MEKPKYYMNEYNCSMIKRNMVEVLGLVDKLSASFENAGDYEAYDSLQRVIRCCYNVMSNLINVDELNKLENYFPQKVNISQVLEDIVSVTRSKLRNCGVRILCDCGKNIIAYTDPDRFVSALMNLIVNSVQNVERGNGVVKIKAIVLGSNISISVSDNGYGMDREELNECLSSDDACGFKVVSEFCKAADTKLFTDVSADGGLLVSFRLPIAGESSVTMKSPRASISSGAISNVSIYLSKIDDAILF